MIDREGQVWEDTDGELVYLVYSSYQTKPIVRHRVLILYSNVLGYNEGDTVLELESVDRPWEEPVNGKPQRRRLT